MQRMIRMRPLMVRVFVVVLAIVAVVVVLALPHLGTQAAATGANVRVKVQVPAGMNSAPFDVDRFLNVPPGFSIGVFARVPNARFMAVAPNGDLLVSQPGQGTVLLLRPNGNNAPQQFTFASGMSKPHDIVFHTYNNQTYVFIAAEDAIYRFAYTSGATQAGARATVVANLPNGSSGELQGRYGHTLKNIAIDSNNMLYVSIASATNADPSDLQATPKRGAIYTYNATGSNQDGASGKLFAQGLRNAEGLAFSPNGELWVVVNNRDNIACPIDLKPIPGATVNCAKGEVQQAYVDNHPPEEFTRVRDGGNYGWPFCNPNPDTASGMDNMPFDLDMQNNPNGSKLDCTKADRIDKGIQAHSAPLGVTFMNGSQAPLAYRNGAVVGLHGSWNRAKKTGYKFVFFPWGTTNKPGAQIDLVTGWLDSASGDVWGRPVDSAVAPDGALYLSDDYSGTIYRLVSDAPQFNVTMPFVNK